MTMQPFYYSSDDAGAPVLNNAPGSLLGVLRACGIDGYNEKTVTSISVASGVATASITAHGFSSVKAQLVQFSGASNAGLNGNKQPTSVTADTLTYAAPGVPDGTYTGTITARRAPFGLTEVHTGTNKAIFGRAAPEAAAALLRVDDSASGVTDARAISVESATDVDTYTAESPLDSLIAGGFYWRKGANTATAKRWFVVGCAVGFWLFTEGANTSEMVAQQWLDLDSIWPGDAYNTVISGTPSATAGATSVANFTMRPVVVANSIAYTNPTAMPRIQRDAAGVSGADATTLIGPYASADIGQVGMGAFDHVPLLRPLHVVSGSGTGHRLRGVMRGLVAPLAALPYANGEIVTDQDGGAYLSVRVRGLGVLGNSLVSLNPDW